MALINKIIKLFTASAFFTGIIVAGFLAFQFFDAKTSDLNARLNQSILQNEKTLKQTQVLSDAYNELYAELKEKPTETGRREIIKEKSQDELLTLAVAKTAPAVVSIAVTKDIPQLEVVYINPFGDDPFYKDFNIRVPRYRQKGTIEKKVGAGTGFIVNSNGYIATNRHVVEDQSARYTALLSNGVQRQAEVVYIDKEIDIAILKIEGSGFPAISFGNSDSLKLGQSVFAIGNALGEYNNSVSVGIVSGLNRNIEAFSTNGSEKLQGVIQTDAAINPGNSGGPLVNLSGEVIGINVAMAAAENIGFAIPANAIKPIIDSQVR